MKKPTHVSAMAAALTIVLLTGCKTCTPIAVMPEGPAVLSTGTATEIKNAAIAAARADVAADRPRVAYTGGFGRFAVGVPEEDLALVEGLPQVPLPSGCTIPLLHHAMIYAEAYNSEILPYIISKHELHK